MLVLLFFVTRIAVIYATINYKLTSIYYGNQGWSMDEIEYFSSWTSQRPTVIVLFTDWCNGSMIDLFNTQLNNIWNNHSIPLITWEPFECGGASQPGIMKLVRNNVYDTYINQFGNRLQTWLAGNDGILGNTDDRRVYLRLAHEMNGNWYPWSAAVGNSIPQDYILAWHHIHDIFSNKSLDSTRLQWIWCVNNADVGNYTAEDYWVGDSYVDWIGVDGYNWGATQSWSTWLSPNQIFSDMISRVRLLSSTKPLCISEYGTTSKRIGNVSDTQSKNDWLNEFCAYMNNTQIQMAPYFNTDKETDWAIFGGMNGNTMWTNFSAYTAYKDCLQSNDWVLPDSTNQRIITDEQFAGIGKI
ncbi:unnamed protein product [Rotaria sp. Silwood1]|nr:unnamed protein product [Rotaria sp. Silwood1]CAF1499826.1 unnamed protein product [Rotaria sp. Silwood1]